MAKRTSYLISEKQIYKYLDKYNKERAKILARQQKKAPHLNLQKMERNINAIELAEEIMVERRLGGKGAAWKELHKDLTTYLKHNIIRLI